MNPNLLLAIPVLPLLGAVVAGLFGKVVGRAGAHTVTIAAVAVSCGLSLLVWKDLVWGGAAVFNGPVYTWLVSDGLHFEVGFLIDRLSALMMVVVTFVSLCVHVYTIGYMADDPGYQRFFSYISLFTFSMLMLVMANNFMQLFFGWEAVGVVSYSGSLDYQAAFAAAPHIAAQNFALTPGTTVPAMTLICICLFVGAMGKSAQVPLHVWLPDSMEGPTPISALIHAATMVTAGIFMVARMSPLFEQSDQALSFVLVIGATTAFFMGLLGVVANDIKRVIAYSTLSQLGYMTVALGVSAYSGAIFHLMTHAFFKALLFLAAGSVIIGMHHEQDMRKMGGLAKYMPWTAVTSWIGSLALIGTPFFAGFYSKDAIIEAVGESHRWGSGYAYACVLGGVFVPALYTLRMLFMTFRGPERFHEALAHGHEDSGHAVQGHDAHGDEAHVNHEEAEHGDHGSPGGVPHETAWVVRGPLVALAIPSVVIGALCVKSVLFGGYFGNAIFVLPANDVMARLGEELHDPVWLTFALKGFMAPAFWLALSGVIAAWVFFLKKPEWADAFGNALSPLR